MDGWMMMATAVTNVVFDEKGIPIQQLSPQIYTNYTLFIDQ